MPTAISAAASSEGRTGRKALRTFAMKELRPM